MLASLGSDVVKVGNRGQKAVPRSRRAAREAAQAPSSPFWDLWFFIGIALILGGLFLERSVAQPADPYSIGSLGATPARILSGSNGMPYRAAFR